MPARRRRWRASRCTGQRPRGCVPLPCSRRTGRLSNGSKLRIPSTEGTDDGCSTRIARHRGDSKTLYREEVFTDRKAGTIRRVLPLSFEIEAGTLAEAAERFPAAVHVALEQAIEEAREYRREASSRIVVPDVAGGALPGGGKIKL